MFAPTRSCSLLAAPVRTLAESAVFRELLTEHLARLARDGARRTAAALLSGLPQRDR